MTSINQNQKPAYAAGIVDDSGRGRVHWMHVVAVAPRANDAWTAAKERLLSDGKSVRRVFCAPVNAFEWTEIESALAAGLTPMLRLPEAA